MELYQDIIAALRETTSELGGKGNSEQLLPVVQKNMYTFFRSGFLLSYPQQKLPRSHIYTPLQEFEEDSEEQRLCVRGYNDALDRSRGEGNWQRAESLKGLQDQLKSACRIDESMFIVSGMLGPHVLAVHLTEGAATLHVPAAHSPISQRKLPTRNF